MTAPYTFFLSPLLVLPLCLSRALIVTKTTFYGEGFSKFRQLRDAVRRSYRLEPVLAAIERIFRGFLKLTATEFFHLFKSEVFRVF